MTLSSLKNNHQGERIFLIGNGPSLEKTPLAMLNGEYTLAMNKIDNIFSQTSWRPSYYLDIRNSPPTDERLSRIEKLLDCGAQCFLRENGNSRDKEFFSNREYSYFLHVTEINSGQIKVDIAADDGQISKIWADDITETVYRQHTSMYTAAQLANYMGFDELFFVGCDLYPEFKPFPYMIFKSGSDPQEYRIKNKSKIEFILSNGRPFRSFINGFSYKLLRDSCLISKLYRIYEHFGLTRQTHCGGNHHPDDIYKVGKNDKLIRAHRAIKTIGRKKGFSTFNATLGGELEVHDRVDLENIIKS